MLALRQPYPGWLGLAPCPARRSLRHTSAYSRRGELNERLEDLRRRLEAANLYHATLGVRVVSLEEGIAEVLLPFRRENTQQSGVLQGGFLTVVADAAMTYAIQTRLAPDRSLTTVDLQIAFLAAVRDGDVRARGRVVRLGRTLAFAEADLLAPDGTLVARASSTSRLF